MVDPEDRSRPVDSGSSAAGGCSFTIHAQIDSLIRQKFKLYINVRMIASVEE